MGCLGNIATVTTVILGEHPEVQAIIEQRRALGQDGRDEVREGVYYVVPRAHVHHALVRARLIRILDDLASPRGFMVSGEFNLGEPNDYRIPDLGLHRGTPDDELFVPAVAMIVDILAPNAKTFDRFDFYGRHGVEEILVVDLAERSIRHWAFNSALSSYLETDDSAAGAILGASCAELQTKVSWP
jgi:hypothetical protein